MSFLGRAGGWHGLRVGSLLQPGWQARLTLRLRIRWQDRTVRTREAASLPAVVSTFHLASLCNQIL